MSTSGRHFLQVPGPTNIPDRVLKAIHAPGVDHRGPHFLPFAIKLLEDVKTLFKTKETVAIWPSSGTGAWEAALVNTLSPGDKVLMFDAGMFSNLWVKMGKMLQLDVQVVENDWRRGADPAVVEEKLTQDKNHAIKAVCIVHNETSNGVLARLADIRKAMDAAKHPALLLVDSISGLGCTDYQHDQWGVDVTICGSQKGMMLPTGLGFNAISKKAREAYKSSKMPRSYWDWEWMTGAYDKGIFPYTPAASLMNGLRASIDMMHEEGLENIFARHNRFATATRKAVEAWGLEVVCQDEREFSPSVSAIYLPEGHSADAFRRVAFERFNISLGAGLGKFADRVFRIGHMGDLNEAMLTGALSSVEMGLRAAGVPHTSGGVDAAIAHLSQAN
ncbi:MAG: aminotransferase class V-fold PLP-dependent enzyme [Alphaproteobacteria bacterium]